MPGNSSVYQCAVIGDWHLAFVTSACLAQLGHKTLLVNPLINPEKWNAFPKPPVEEPGLVASMENSRSKDLLAYANGIDDAWKADFVWIAIDTPVNERDEPDTSPLLRVAAQLHELRSFDVGVIVSSQVPLGFCAQLEKQFNLPVVYIPENLRLGKGIETFLTADRTVVGASTKQLGQSVLTFLKGLQTDFLSCDLPTAEMIKHATNAFLATSISFANEIARIGETMGVDSQVVGKALKMDKRIGKAAYVAPGLGFAGGTLPRDLRVLQSLGKQNGRPTPLVDSVLGVNESTSNAIYLSLESHLESFAKARVLIVGYTYKAETDTLRRSMSIELASALRQAGAEVWGYDPVLNESDLSLVTSEMHHFSKWSDIPDCPDAVVIMTPREIFKNLDWSSLSSKKTNARTPLVLDARALVAGESVTKPGFAYKALWQPTVYPTEV